MMKSLPVLAPAIFLLFSACSQEVGAPAEELGADEKADQIADFDDPSGLLGRVDTTLAANVTADDVGRAFGVPDGSEPYPDTYWPMDENGIDAEWNGAESPLEKYMSLANPGQLEAAKAWNRKNHGTDVPGVASWWGICNGWTGAAIYEQPVKKAVHARREGDGVVSCTAGTDGCVTFEIGDVNALLAELYLDADSAFIGARCDTKPQDVKRDRYGRIDRDRNGAGCKGLNPGALMIVLGQRLKKDKKPFAIDAQTERNTDQIWNQPAYEYAVNRLDPLTAKEAANLVATGKRTGSQTRYRWNDRAKGFAFVDVTLRWVTENGPNVEYVSGRRSSRETRMVAVLELDKPASDPSAKIVGGEYLDDPSAGANRLRNAPFVWLVKEAPAGPANERNPHLDAKLVRGIAALGQR